MHPPADMCFAKPLLQYTQPHFMPPALRGCKLALINRLQTLLCSHSLPWVANAMLPPRSKETRGWFTTAVRSCKCTHHHNQYRASRGPRRSRKGHARTL